LRGLVFNPSAATTATRRSHTRLLARARRVQSDSGRADRHSNGQQSWRNHLLHDGWNHANDFVDAILESDYADGDYDDRGARGGAELFTECRGDRNLHANATRERTHSFGGGDYRQPNDAFGATDKHQFLHREWWKQFGLHG
jgi:hypothetical protein